MSKALRSPLFSIILPIYKVEEYLNECVDSILNQSFINYEIILVDDGSPDKCPEICDKYAENDDRINVIHKNNGGLSSARNRGVESAKGEYIIFVDSDDYWNDNGALDDLARKIEELKSVDILVFNNIDYSCLTGESVVCNRAYDIDLLENSSKEVVLKYFFDNGLFPGAAWVTVTRRKFLEENGITFIEGIKAEDIDWLLNVFLNAQKFSAVNNAFYVYRKYRGGSITGTADIKSVENILYTLEIWIEKLNDENYEGVKDKVLGFLCNHYMCAVLIYDNLPEDQKKCCKDKLQKYQFIVSYSPTTLIRTFGHMPIGILSKFLNLYRKRRRF